MYKSKVSCSLVNHLGKYTQYQYNLRSRTFHLWREHRASYLHSVEYLAALHRGCLRHSSLIYEGIINVVRGDSEMRLLAMRAAAAAAGREDFDERHAGAR